LEEYKVKVRDLKIILEELDDEVEVILETENNELYDCYAEIKNFIVGEKLPYLVLAKE